jgi:DNA invertase Pin-like site-specific DNA recombinase
LIKKVPFCQERTAMAKYGYTRTSTNKQLMDRQLFQLEEICDQVFVEAGVSAVQKHRPVYEEVTSKLTPGDVFVVVSLDRAFRSVIDALSELDKLHKREVAFLSLSQNFDTRTPEGRLLYTISAALAEWERQILSKRTKEGMEAARLRGKQIGRPKKLTAEQVRWAKTQLSAGPNGSKGLNKLSAHLSVSPPTLKRAIDQH